MKPAQFLLLFAPYASAALGQRIAADMGTTLAPMEEREFEGGEHKMRPLCTVRGRNVAVVQSLRGDAEGSANDRLVRLLFFIGALKDAGAAHVTVCTPYLSYARKDRRTQAHDPVSLRYLATLFEAVGSDRVIVLEVHNDAAFDNAFRCETVRLDPAELFASRIQNLVGTREFVVASPDIGGVKRAQQLRGVLEARGCAVSFAFMEKMRSAGTVSGDTWVGDAAGKEVILYDDLIATGGTLLRAAAAARRAGAVRVHAMAAHAAFTDESLQLFGSNGPDTVIVTDSIPLAPAFQSFVPQRLEVCSCANLFAQTLARIERGESLAGLSRHE